MHEELGTGKFGRVVRCTEIKTNQTLACKFIDLKMSNISDILNEISIMQKLQHPRLLQLYDAFQAEGVDEIICLSVNDAFVMFQWGKAIGAQRVRLLPDGNGTFTRQMGMLVRKENLGFGDRSWRYAMVVRDGEIDAMFVEPGFADNAGSDPFEVSDADTVLAYLKGEAAPAAKPERAAFEG